MLKLVIKNLFNKRVTRMYPTSVREPFERSRGQILFEESTCIYCSICARKCPADAITVSRKDSLWELNTFRCIICGLCVTACPKKCISMVSQRMEVANKPKIITMKKNTKE